MSEDGLHLSLAAYRTRAEALEPLLAARLGARAERDITPAPTAIPLYSDGVSAAAR